MKQDRAYWIKQATAAQEYLRRLEANPLLRYFPCCKAHGGRKPDNWDVVNPGRAWIPNKCPVNPCPESKHMKFHTSKVRNRVVFGGNRSSKTFTCMKELVMRMCYVTHPITKEPLRVGDRHGRILAQDYSIHEKKHIPDLYEWIPKAALKYGKTEETKQAAWDRSYDGRNHLLHLVHKSWIDFQTYEQDSSKLESVDLDVWFADEEIPEEHYSACNARLVTRGGVGILGVTPLYSLTWAMKFLDEVSPTVEVFKWGIRDNPHNTEKSIQEFLAGVPELEREARENGDFIEAKGLRYKELDRSLHLIASKQPEPYYPVIMAMDPHQRKGTAITWAFVDPRDNVVFFDELLIEGTADVVVKAIHEKEKSHKARTMLRLVDPAANKQVSGYGSQRTTLTEFQEQGMDFSYADNNDAGYSVVESYLHYDKTKAISNLNQPQVYFTSDVPLTWYGMSHLRWDEFRFNSDRDAKERVKDKDKDFPDTVRYILITRPTFSSGSITPVDINYGATPIEHF
jgi:phage terminase large subunit-like protein